MLLTTYLKGSHILNGILAHSSHPTVHAFARRPLPSTSPQLAPIIESDSLQWPSTFKSLTPPPDIFFSALGTTRGQAGSFEAQRKIDYDLNLALAKTAKEAGVKVYILISSGGVSINSPWPYGKMKAELEEAVKELGFPYTVILKPGLLLGTRQDSRPPEAMIRGIAKGLGMISKGLTDWWTQDADVVGGAAVRAGMMCLEGEKEESVWIVDQKEIVRLGRTEKTKS